jgi:hypothetical protein
VASVIYGVEIPADNQKQAAATLLKNMEDRGIISLTKENGSFVSATILVDESGRQVVTVSEQRRGTQYQNSTFNGETFRRLYLEEKEANPTLSHMSVLRKALERFHEKTEGGSWRYIRGLKTTGVTENHADQIWLKGFVNLSDKQMRRQTWDNIRPQMERQARSQGKTDSGMRGRPSIATTLSEQQFRQLIQEEFAPLQKKLDNLVYALWAGGSDTLKSSIHRLFSEELASVQS